MIGGRGDDQFNRATQARRQPGSAFKPFVYTTAINQGHTAGTVVNDIPVILPTDRNRNYVPQNYDQTYRGFISYRQGLAQSVNIAAVKVAREVSIKNTIDTAQRMGINTFAGQVDYSDKRYSVPLGGLHHGVIPLELAAAYGIFANQGIKTEPFAIKKIMDKRDHTIYEAHPQKEIILEEDTAYIMTDMLTSVITDGTGWRINQSINAPIAGKTGTTNRNTDAWFAGFTPELGHRCLAG